MAKINEQKIFTGGLNTDDAPEFVKQNEYSKAHNIRIAGTTETEAGYVTNIESTELISTSRPEGVNKSIGSAPFPTIRKGYGINYNTQGLHNIYEFDYETKTEVSIFEDLTDSGGEQIFNISPDHYFNDIRLLHDKYLIMCDGFSDIVYFINIEKLKSGGYGVVTKNDFNLLKAQSLIPPKLEYIDDTTKTSNQLKGKMFQFRTQFEYDDNLKSAWSTYSKRVVPELENTEGYNGDVTKLNAIVVTVDIGSPLVTKVRVAARVANGGLFIIREKDTDEIKALPNQYINLYTEVYEAYDASKNTYSFVFYNDGSYEFVDSLEADLNYDNIPQRVGTVEIVNGNILALGDLEEGYERPDVEATVSVSLFNADVNTSTTNPRNFSASATNSRLSGSHKRQISIFISGDPKTGDKISISSGDIRADEPPITNIVEHTVTVSENNNLAALAESIRQKVPVYPIGVPPFNQARAYDRGNNTWEIVYIGNDYTEVKSVNIVYNTVGAVYGKDINVLKTGTGYQLALAHFDEFGRQFPIVTNDGFAIKTPAKTTAKDLTPVIGWQINSTPPEGAVSYQWLISENSYFQKTLQLPAKYDAAESKDDYISLDISALKFWNNTGDTGNVSYDFTQGDRVTFLYTFENLGTSGSPIPEKWFDAPPIDLEVLSFEITGDSDPKYLLKVKNSSILNPTLLSNRGVFIELYTSKKSVGSSTDDTTSTVFYEIGEQFPIINGEYSVKTGIITTGDAYYRPRAYRSYEDANVVYGFLVEDFSFSDYTDSAYWSAGRGRVYNDEIGKTSRIASIRYSDPYTYGSNVNNINRFYGERLYGELPGETSSKYGSITKLQMRDNYLVCLQELKVGHIPVNLSIIEDSLEQAQVAISTKLLNNVRYLPKNIGTGLAKEAIAVSKKGAIYFVDINNGYPCKDDYNGLDIISGKMSKYFMDTLKQAKLGNVKLVSNYDEFYDEWNISKISQDGVLKNIKFSDNFWDNTDAYQVNNLRVIDVTHGTVSSIVDGNVIFTPEPGYIGTAGFKIAFEDQDGNTIIKNVCLEIVPVSEVVDDFSFVPKLNANTSTLYESNEIVITGNDVPVELYALGGDYQINGGAWIFGTITNVNAGDIVKVRGTSSATPETETTVTLYVGEGANQKNAPFSITTRDDLPVNVVQVLAVLNQSTPSADYYTSIITSDKVLQEAIAVGYYYIYTNTLGLVVNSSQYDTILYEGESQFTKPYSDINDVQNGTNPQLVLLYSEPVFGSVVKGVDNVDYYLDISGE